VRLEELREEVARLARGISKKRLDEVMKYAEEYGDERELAGHDRGWDEALGSDQGE
jgi:hypothetical protein